MNRQRNQEQYLATRATDLEEEDIGQEAYQRFQTPSLFWLNIASIIIAYIVLIGYALNFAPLTYLRPIPIFIMAIYLHLMNPTGLTVPNFIKYGLIAHFIGDIFLVLSGTTMFIIGLIFYLIGLLLYIKAYWTGSQYRSMEPPMLYFRTTMIVILCVLLLFQLFRLFEYYPSKIFFPIYVIVVTAMMISATLRYERTVDKSFYMIRIGSLLYGISNAVLLFFKFRFTKYNDGDNINLIAMVIIVLLYYVAQYLITHGSLYHKRGEAQNNYFDQQ